ncbi:MAG: FtsQ-type POTRA domain-containing protein [Anaerolineales bacterium]|nr:FtsQ-type POTRA domain-containing protein [Anaerolineales bacterium]
MSVGDRAFGVPENRADQVRARRVRKVRKVERAGRFKTTKPRRNKRARRRYDVPVSADHGTEIQLTGISGAHFGSRLFSIVLLGASLWMIVRFMQAPTYKAGMPMIDGQQMLSLAQVRSLAGVEGQSAFLVDPEVVEARLKEAAEVSEATVTLKWPNRVEILLEEHQPSVEWNDGGRIWWLSADGTAYIQHGIQSDLTQVTSADPVLNFDGNANDPVIDPALLSAVDVLSKHMPEVSSWQFDTDHGLSFDDVRGWQAYFGEGGDMRMKVRIYNTIADKLFAENIPVTMVSVEDQHTPFYAME